MISIARCFLEPNWAVLYCNKASAFIVLDRPAEAEQAAHRAVLLDPDWVEARYMLALAMLTRARKLRRSLSISRPPRKSFPKRASCWQECWPILPRCKTTECWLPRLCRSPRGTVPEIEPRVRSDRSRTSVVDCTAPLRAARDFPCISDLLNPAILALCSRERSWVTGNTEVDSRKIASV
jgi:hypothetical protein